MPPPDEGPSPGQRKSSIKWGRKWWEGSSTIWMTRPPATTPSATAITRRDITQVPVAREAETARRATGPDTDVDRGSIPPAVVCRSGWPAGDGSPGRLSLRRGSSRRPWHPHGPVGFRYEIYLRRGAPAMGALHSLLTWRPDVVITGGIDHPA